MAGIIPNVTAGAIEVRDVDGNCLSPSGVSNAYCPPSTFVTTCALTYLPDGCGARITAAQLNAFQSELICLAERFNPTGTWNCGSLCNLSNMFNSWVNGSHAGSLSNRIAQILCGASTITDAQLAANALAGFVMCDGAGGITQYFGRPFSSASGVVTAICASPAARTALQDCLKLYPEVAVALNSGLSVVKTTALDGHDIYTIGVAAATTAVPGVAKLADVNNFPEPLNNTDIVTPAYMNEAISNLPEDTTSTVLATVIAAEPGLSQGQWNKPLNVAALAADMALAGADRVEVPVRAMSTLWGNRAAEPTLTNGVMNFDGTLGHYSRQYASGGALAASQTALNNAVMQSNGADASIAYENGNTIVMPSSSYSGQLLTLRAGSLDATTSELIVDFSVASSSIVGGVFRHSDHVVRNGGAGGSHIIMRGGEVLQLVGIGGGGWRVRAHQYELVYGSNWRENTNGTITAHFNAQIDNNQIIAGGDGLIGNITLPVVMATDQYYLVGNDRFVATAAVVDGPVIAAVGGLVSPMVVQHIVGFGSSTTTTAKISVYNSSTALATANIAPGVMAFTLYGVPDYAALGGIASF